MATPQNSLFWIAFPLLFCFCVLFGLPPRLIFTFYCFLTALCLFLLQFSVLKAKKNLLWSMIRKSKSRKNHCLIMQFSELVSKSSRHFIYTSSGKKTFFSSRPWRLFFLAKTFPGLVRRRCLSSLFYPKFFAFPRPGLVGLFGLSFHICKGQTGLAALFVFLLRRS